MVGSGHSHMSDDVDEDEDRKTPVRFCQSISPRVKVREGEMTSDITRSSSSSYLIFVSEEPCEAPFVQSY